MDAQVKPSIKTKLSVSSGLKTFETALPEGFKELAIAHHREIIEHERQKFPDEGREFKELPILLEKKARENYVNEITYAPLKCYLFDSKKIIGFSVGYREADTIVTTDTYVSPKYRKRGLHDRMTARFEQYGREIGVKRIVRSYLSKPMIKAFQRRAKKPVYKNLQAFIKRDQSQTIQREKYKLQDHYRHSDGTVIQGAYGIIDLTLPGKPERIVSRAELERLEKEKRIQERIAQGLPVTQSKKKKPKNPRHRI